MAKKPIKKLLKKQSDFGAVAESIFLSILKKMLDFLYLLRYDDIVGLKEWAQVHSFVLVKEGFVYVKKGDL